MSSPKRRHARVALWGLVAMTCATVTATTARVRAEDGSDPVAEASIGMRSTRSGALTLPASGFEVRVPKAHRAATEAFGRVVFRPDGPEVSDEIAVAAAEGPLALSVIVGGPSCEAFEGIGSVEKGVRVGRATWSRLDQTLAPPPTQNGAAGPASLKAAVWCRPGVLVHTVAAAGHPGVPLWLDALAKLKPPSSRAFTGAATLAHVFVERPEVPDEVLVMPVRQRFVVEALAKVWETDAPIGRVPRPAGAPDQGPGEPPTDRFEVLVPRAWLVRFEIARVDARGCLRLKRAPRGFPKAPAGFFWATSQSGLLTTTAPKAQAFLCQDRDAGPLVRITVSTAVSMPTALVAAMPILNELAALLPGDSQPAIEP